MRPLGSFRDSCLAETGIDVFQSFKNVLAPFFAIFRSPCPYVTFMAADVVVDARGQGWLLEFEIRPQISTGRIPMVERVHDGLATGLVPIMEAHLQGLPLPRDNPAWNWVDV